jgi:electron transfer flavoprotein alpha/beta subunit
VLKGVVDAEQPGLVILGKQAIDDDANQTDQMLSTLRGWSQGTFASKLEIEGDQAKVTREVDGGLQTVSLKMLAIITTDLRLRVLAAWRQSHSQSKPHYRTSPLPQFPTTAPRADPELSRF